MPASTEEIWERFSGELRAFIGRRVRDADLAVDLLQETFVRVHQGLGGVKNERRMLAWLYRVARNTIADHFRRATHGATDDVVDVPAEAEQPDNFNEDVGRWLLELLPAIPESYRAALRLAEVEGLTQREVGERLGLSLSGAKSRVQRGRDMLRELLLECCHLDFDRRGNVVEYVRHGTCAGCCRKADARSCDPLPTSPPASPPRA